MITRANFLRAPEWPTPVRYLVAVAVAFAALVLVASTGLVPAWLQALGNDVSRTCLVTAIVAIGMKTRLRELAAVGWRPVLLLLLETVFLACFVIGAMRWLG